MHVNTFHSYFLTNKTVLAICQTLALITQLLWNNLNVLHFSGHFKKGKPTFYYPLIHTTKLYNSAFSFNKSETTHWELMHSHAYRYPQNIKSCPPKSRLIDNILISEPQPCLNWSVNLVINEKYKRNIKADRSNSRQDFSFRRNGGYTKKLRINLWDRVLSLSQV